MTQNDKELLLQDLCSRLPYQPKLQIYYEEMSGSGVFDEELWEIDGDGQYCNGGRRLEDIKPYLRPMLSMTEEEDKEYAKVIVKSQDCSLENSESATTMANDWLLSKGFDVRGLISKGLALKAPEEMYKKWTSLRGNLKEDNQGNIVGGLKL